MEKLRRELEAAVEALEQGRHELSSFAEQVWYRAVVKIIATYVSMQNSIVVTRLKIDISMQCDRVRQVRKLIVNWAKGGTTSKARQQK